MLPAVPHGLQIGFVFKKGAVLNGAADPGQILKDHPPAPMLVWPTSELPICPSGRPTSKPEADSRQPGLEEKILSRFGVWRWPRALPVGVVPQAEAVHDDQGSWCFHRKTSNSKW